MSQQRHSGESRNPVTDNLDLWTSALLVKSTAGRGSNGRLEAYGIRKLRELILELAVCGKLMPQDTNDESAHVLLKKIEEEKVRLGKNGLLAKQAPLPKVAEGDECFRLPNSWAWSRLGEITNYGITDKAEPEDVSEDTWCLDLEDVEKDTSRLLQKSRFSEKPFKSSKNRFNRGDVIYGKLRPYLDKVLVADEEGVCTTEMVPVRGYLGLSPFYLRLVMKTPRFIKYADDSTHGMNLPRLSTDRARMAVFPLAPLAEQHRIVAKVDELMALCDQLELQQVRGIGAHQTLVETLLGTLTSVESAHEFGAAWNLIAEHFDTLFTSEHSIDLLKQAIRQLAVMGKLVPQDANEEGARELLAKVTAENARRVKKKAIENQEGVSNIRPEETPYELPQSWVWVRLPNAAFFQEGPGIMAKDFRDQGIPLIRIAGMHNDFVSLDGCNFLEEDMVAKKWSHFRLELGDIVLSASASLGKVAKVGDEAVGCIVYTGLIRFQPFACLNADYLIKFLSSNEFELQINKSKTGAAIMHFGPTHLKTMLVPIPPLAEQRRIVAKVDELMTLCDGLKARLAEAQTTQIHLADAIVERTVA